MKAEGKEINLHEAGNAVSPKNTRVWPHDTEKGGMRGHRVNE